MFDLVLVAIPIYAIGLIFGAHPFGHRNASGHVVAHVPAWYLAAGAAVSWGYALLTQCRRGPHNGQTLGRQLLAIRVVRDDGRPYGAVTFLVRDVICKNLVWWSRFSSALSFPFVLLAPLDDLWPLWDRENRALHDFFPRTHVRRA